MDVFKLSRNWFDFCFENPDKVTPNHSAIYFFAIEHCNRLGWKDKFGYPSQMAMEAVGIKNWRTFIKAFNDLVDWGFIKLIEKSKNQYSANVIAIVENTKANTKALDKALQKHSQKQYKSIVGINIQETNKQETNKQEIEIEFEKFRKIYPGTKNGLKTELDNFKNKHKDYQKIIPKLVEIITNQIRHKEIQKAKGVFIPEWKNLKTWINQRCWEEEYTTVNNLPPPQKQRTLADNFRDFTER